MVVVTTEKKIKGKLSDRDTVCKFVGYPQNHLDDVYFLVFSNKIIHKIMELNLVG
jgi:hypothetical protein